jgi:uncharacterized membrane protein
MVLLALSLGGLVVSLFLAYTYTTGSRLLCDGGSDCEYVAQSSYSRIADIPIPFLGMAGYLFLIVLSAMRIMGSSYRQWLVLATFGAGLLGFLFSAFLTSIEIFVLYAICPWCLASAVLMTAIFAISIRDLFSG